MLQCAFKFSALFYGQIFRNKNMLPEQFLTTRNPQKMPYFQHHLNSPGVKTGKSDYCPYPQIQSTWSSQTKLISDDDQCLSPSFPPQKKSKTEKGRNKKKGSKKINQRKITKEENTSVYQLNSLQNRRRSQKECELNQYTFSSEETTSSLKQRINQPIKNETILGGKQYLATLLIRGNSDQSIFFYDKKKLISGKNQIVWDFDRKPQTSLMFQPNMVLIPKDSLTMELRLVELQENNQQKDLIDIRVQNLKQGSYILTLQNEIKLKIQFSLIRSKQDQRKLIDEMNFKFPFKDFQVLFLLQRIKVQNFSNQQSDSEQQKQENNVLNQLKTQEGSKKYQKLILSMTPQQTEKLLKKIYKKVPQLVRNQFANYMIQSLFKKINSDQKLKLLEHILPQIKITLSTKEGTFTFQQILEHIQEKQIQMIFLYCSESFDELALNSNASHFLRKFIKYFTQKQCFRMLTSLEPFFVQLSKDRNGLCVLKELVRSCSKYHSLKFTVLQNIANKVDEIINNEFGNYLIQEVYQIFGENQTDQLDHSIVNRLVTYGSQKYSSIVILKCLKKYWRNKKSILCEIAQNIRNKDVKRLQKTHEGIRTLTEMQNIKQLSENMTIKRSPKKAFFHPKQLCCA